MKRDANDFIEEITNNFSELFTETFFLRYLSDYQIDDLLENITKTKYVLNKKIEKNFLHKLKELGFNNIITNKKEE